MTDYFKMLAVVAICITLCFIVDRICKNSESTTWKDVEITKASENSSYTRGFNAGWEFSANTEAKTKALRKEKNELFGQ